MNEWKDCPGRKIQFRDIFDENGNKIGWESRPDPKYHYQRLTVVIIWYCWLFFLLLLTPLVFPFVWLYECSLKSLKHWFKK